jgi:hypothetical protein
VGEQTALALGLLVAADVLDTVMQPAHAFETANVLKMGALAGLRTALAYFLGKEIKELEEAEHHAAQAHGHGHSEGHSHGVKESPGGHALRLGEVSVSGYSFTCQTCANVIDLDAEEVALAERLVRKASMDMDHHSDDDGHGNGHSNGNGNDPHSGYSSARSNHSQGSELSRSHSRSHSRAHSPRASLDRADDSSHSHTGGGGSISLNLPFGTLRKESSISKSGASAGASANHTVTHRVNHHGKIPTPRAELASIGEHVDKKNE